MSRKEPGQSPYYHNLGHYLHDLAQPLATVTGLVDLLLLELDEQDSLFTEVQLISEQLGKILTIIAEIRRIAREAADHEAKPLKSARSSLS